jgi:hypothetical protein
MYLLSAANKISANYRSASRSLSLSFFIVLFCLASAPTNAHSLGEGYLYVNVSDSSLDGWVELTLDDLNAAVNIDAGGDGKVSADEIEANLQKIQQYLSNHVSIGDGSRDYVLDFTDYELLNVSFSQYALFNYVTNETAIPDVLETGYNILFDYDEDHRGFLVIASNSKSEYVNSGEDVALIFTPDRRKQDIDFSKLSPWTSFFDFLRHGVWHIWIGFDHVLFLLALMLPAVLVRSNGAWQPVGNFRQAVWNTAKIVSLFTVAHSITLTLAVLEIVSIPGRLVESIIAISVLLAALNNIFPVVRNGVGWIVFSFGLFHGFGFASVLQDLSTNAANVAADLAGFNVGVELGQLAIIAIAFPFLYAVRAKNFYFRGVLPVGSGIIALLALGWLLERVSNSEFMPF